MTTKLRLLIVTLSFLVVLPAVFGQAQEAKPTENATTRFDGWNRVSDKTTQSPTSDTAVQTAYYQAQGSLSDSRSVLPAGNAVTPPAIQASPVLPSLPPVQSTRSTGGDLLPPYQNSQLGSPLSPPPVGNGAVNPMPTGNQRWPQNGQTLPPPAQREIMPQPSGPQGLRPQNAQPGSPANFRTVAGQRTSGDSTRGQAGELRATTNPGAGQNLRRTNAAPSGRLDPNTIATGLPFVTPPPGTGRYMTSPYNHAMFQMAAYRRVQPVNSAPRSATNQLVSTQVASNTRPVQQQLLPQYRSQPGVYPTTYQCVTPPAPSFPSTGAVPGSYVPPTYTPNLTPGVYTPNNAGYSPLFSLGQENYNVRLGRGLVGQPTVYVPGQPLRNFMRYLSP